MSFSGRLSVSTTFTYQDNATVTQSTSGNSIINHEENYAEGTGTLQAKYAYSKDEPSNASAVTYSLRTGGLKDQVGRSIVLAKLNTLVVRNTGSASLTVGNGTSNGVGILGTPVTLVPGAVLALSVPTGYTIDATHETLKVTPAAATTWQIQFTGSD